MRKVTREELGRVTPGEFKEQTKMPIAVVLDNVRSALNVGSVFRTADAFALEKIYLCGITATPPHREILKTALGATETVAWEFTEQTLDAIAELKMDGYQVWAIEQVETSVPLQYFDFKEKDKIALVFGNEVNGVGEDALAASNGFLEIPQFGTKHSLNVAVCVGIVAWELVRKHKFPQTILKH